MHFPKFLFVLLVFISCQKQIESKADINIDEIELSDEVKILRDSIALYNRVESERLGIAGFSSRQFKRYKRINTIATDHEIYKLGHDTNAVVATYAGYALATRDKDLFKHIFIRFITDSTIIYTTQGCIFGSSTVAYELYSFYKSLLYDKSDSDNVLTEDRFLLTLDSLILTSSPVDPQLTESAYLNRTYPNVYLNIIEHHAFTELEINAIKYLHLKHGSKYKQQILESIMIMLKNELSISTYEEIYDIMLSYKESEIDDILLLELQDIKEQHGEGWYEEFRKKFGLLHDEELRV